MEEISIAIMSGPQDGAVLAFERMLDSDEPVEITIGRREDCDVSLNYDSQVSREHAMLVYDSGEFWLEDRNSTNGTYIGDDQISGRVSLTPGQLFRVGRTWLRVEPVTSYDIDDDLPF